MNYDRIMDYVWALTSLVEEIRTVKAVGRQEVFDNDNSHVNTLNLISDMAFDALTVEEHAVARHLLNLISVMGQEEPDPGPWYDVEYATQEHEEAYFIAMREWRHDTTQARLEYEQITRYLHED